MQIGGGVLDVASKKAQKLLKKKKICIDQGDSIAIEKCSNTFMPLNKVGMF